MSNNYTFKTPVLKATTGEVTNLHIEKDGEFQNILDVIPSVNDGNKSSGYGIPPKIEFLGKFVNTIPVYDSQNRLTNLKIYIQENRSYPELDKNIISDTSVKTFYIYDNGADAPSDYSWGDAYDYGHGNYTLKNTATDASSSWGNIIISAGGAGDSIHHGNIKGFSLPNLTSKIRTSVYINNSVIPLSDETAILNSDVTVSHIEAPISFAYTAKKLIDTDDTNIGDEGRTPNTMEITGFETKIDLDKFGISPATGGYITYKIEIINKNSATLVYERTNAIFCGVYEKSSLTLSATPKTTKTRIVSGAEYICEDSIVDVAASDAHGFTGGVRNTLALWKLTPNKGLPVAIDYNTAGLSHTNINTADDVVSITKEIKFTGTDFDGTYNITPTVYGGYGNTATSYFTLIQNGLSPAFDNVWANPKTASSNITENFADSDSIALRLNPDLTTPWSWDVTTQATCKPQGSGDGKGKLIANGATGNVEHVRHIYNTDNAYKSNFNITFEKSSEWSDWNKIKVLCATKNNNSVWYAINCKANTYKDGFEGISNKDITNSLTTFECSFPTGINTRGVDGIYIKIILPSGTSAEVYPYTVTFK